MRRLLKAIRHEAPAASVAADRLGVTDAALYPFKIAHGPVGRLLAASGRSPMRASHLHFLVQAPGLRRLVTHIFVRGDELVDSDSVFGVRESLIKEFATQPAGTPTPDGRHLTGSAWTRVRFDIVLAPART